MKIIILLLISFSAFGQRERFIRDTVINGQKYMYLVDHRLKKKQHPTVFYQWTLDKKKKKYSKVKAIPKK